MVRYCIGAPGVHDLAPALECDALEHGKHRVDDLRVSYNCAILRRTYLCCARILSQYIILYCTVHYFTLTYEYCTLRGKYAYIVETGEAEVGPFVVEVAMRCLVACTYAYGTSTCRLPGERAKQ